MRVLGVGVATLDIINSVARYPGEDAEVRALAQRRVRGGNATNTLVVLSQLGHDCAWTGTLSGGHESRFILDDLAGYGIDISRVVRHTGATVPTSCVCHSRETGSRTIVHFRDLAELSAAEFNAFDLGGLDWVHFEGRDPEQTHAMLAHLSRHWPALPCSLEVEKPRSGIETLFRYPRLLLFSRGYARYQGFSDPRRFLDWARGETTATLACAWGEAGASAMESDGVYYQSPAYPPARLVDTLGAGDVFNAALIDGVLRGVSLSQALTGACRLAGRKCGRTGFDGLLDDPSQWVAGD